MIYLFVFFCSIWLLWVGDVMKVRCHLALENVAILPVVLIAGLRDASIGTDTAGYPNDLFDYCLYTRDFFVTLLTYLRVESGYVALAYFSSMISKDFNFFLTVTHFVILGTLLRAYKQFDLKLPCAFLFFYFIFFSESLNAARQFLAMPFCLLSLAELVKKQHKNAIVFFLIAFFFHRSSFFFLTIFCLYYLCINHFKIMKQKKMFFYLTLLVMVGLTMFVELLEFAISIGIAKAEYMDRYGSEEQYGAGIPVSLLSINCFNYLLFQLLTRRKELTPFLLFSKYVMLICVFLCFAGLISTYAVRLDHYYVMTGIVCTVYALQLNKYHYLPLYIVFYVFYWYMVVIVANLGNTYPYKSFIIESLL